MRYMNSILLACMGVFTACQTEKEYDATGTFESAEIIVSSEASGRLLEFYVEEGMEVRKGVELGFVDTIQLYLSKCQLEAGMKSLDSQRPDIAKQIAATMEQIATAEREYARVENLLKVNAANRKQLDDWESRLAVLRKQLEAQKSSLGNTDSSLSEQSLSVSIQIAQIEDKLQKCHISSPISGTVLAKYSEPGELVTFGKPLFKVADMKKIFLRAYVTSRQLSQVKLGDEVTIYADFGGDEKKEYSGKVTWIADESEFTPKTILTDDERANQVYAVKIAVENDGTIKLGMYGEVKFQQ